MAVITKKIFLLCLFCRSRNQRKMCIISCTCVLYLHVFVLRNQRNDGNQLLDLKSWWVLSYLDYSISNSKKEYAVFCIVCLTFYWLSLPCKIKTAFNIVSSSWFGLSCVHLQNYRTVNWAGWSGSGDSLQYMLQDGLLPSCEWCWTVNCKHEEDGTDRQNWGFSGAYSTQTLHPHQNSRTKPHLWDVI